MNLKEEPSLLNKIKSIKINKALLNLFFLIALILAIIISYASYKEVTNLVKANNWVMHTYEVIGEIDNVLYTFGQIESNQRAFLVTNEKHFLDESDNGKLPLETSIDKLKYLIKDNPIQKARIDAFQKSIEYRLQLLADIVYLKKSEPMNTPSNLMLFNRSNEASQQVKALGREIKAVEIVLLKERERSLQSQTGLSSSLILIGSILGLLFLLSAFILLSIELKHRKDIEYSDKKNRSFLSQIIESTSDMIAAFDNSKKFKIFNDSYMNAFKHLFGKSIAIGQELNQLQEGIASSKLALFELWKQTLDPRTPPQVIEFKQDNGSIFYEMGAYEIHDEEHRVRGTVHRMQDITLRIHERNKLQESHEKQAIGIKELQIKNDQITLMVEMSDIMLAANSQEELSSITSSYAQRLLGFGSGYLFMMHPSKNSLEQVGVWGTPKPQEKMVSPEQCWAIRLGRIHITHNDDKEITCHHIHWQEGSLSNAYMCVPLMAQNDIYGMLYIEFEEKLSVKDQDNKLLITAFAELTALAMANVRLRENLRYQSIRDSLTGLYNRRYLEDTLNREMHKASRSKTSFALVMLDLDHFKKINDNFGHDAGDVALKEVGTILEHSIRPGDIASRYGGEEFIIIFNEIHLEEAKKRAAEVKHAINKIQAHYGTQEIGRITISIGIAMYPTDSKEGERLIEYADKALYHAKNTGRNKIAVYSELNSD